MPNLDPTYLRYIYDNLILGSIHPENASELPEGLIGLYEEAFEEHLPVMERQLLLKRFALFALIKKEVSVAFVSEILGESETDTLEFINTYASWFNCPEPGKFQLYHERLKVYLLQKISEKDTKLVNNKIALYLEVHLTKQSESEAEIYALEYLAHHFMVNYILTKNIQPLMNLLKERSFWARQMLISKDYFWTLNSLQHGINTALLANNDQFVIQNTVNFLSVELDLLNDINSLLENLENGEFDISINKLNYIERVNFERLELTIVCILCYSVDQSTLEGKINILKGLEVFMKKYDKKISLELLPDFITFDLANFCFNNNIDYTILYINDKIDIGRERAFKNKPIILNVLKYEKFIQYLLQNKVYNLSTRFIDSLLYSALRKENVTLLNLMLEVGSSVCTADTAERLALFYFYENNTIKFFEVITLDEDYIHIFLTLSMRMLLKEKYDRISQFIDQIPSEFYQLLLYSQLAEASLYLGKNDISESIIDLLKNETRFPKEDSSDLISMLQLKKLIVNYPEEAGKFVNADITTINHVLTALGSKKQALQFYRNTKVSLYLLNNLNINRMSKLLGEDGEIDKFILEKQIELKRSSSTLFLGGYNWEDESVLFFIRGLAEGNFKNNFLKLLNFLIGPENLGALYLIDPNKTKYRLLFYLYRYLIKDNERNKALILKDIIQNDLTESKFQSFPKEVTSRYFDLMYKDKLLFFEVVLKLKSELTSSKVIWDEDYHLAKIAEEYLDNGYGEIGFILLKCTHPSRWKNPKIKSTFEWRNITKKFLDFFILNENINESLELVNRAISPIEMLHRISMEIKIFDLEIKDKMCTMMNEYVKEINVEHSDRITREIKHRNYFSGLILQAELLHQLYGYERSRSIYKHICESLNIIQNHDDLQIIIKKMCLSLVKNKCFEWYSYIINTLFVIESIVIPFGIEGWQKTLIIFREELKLIEDFESIKIIDNKISMLPKIEITKDSKPKKVIKDKPQGYYLVPFENYNMKLYNSSSQEMLNSIIRFAAYRCFVNISNKTEDISILSEILGLKKWIILGLEIQLHLKNKNN